MSKDSTRFVEYLKSAIGKANNNMVKFKSILDTDGPDVAADRVYLLIDAAATLHVYGRALDALTNPESKATLDTLKAYALDRTVINAKSWPHSTFDQKIAASWACLVDDLKWRF